VAGRPLPDGLGVARRHAQPVPLEGLAQRRPASPKLGGGVDAAQPLGQGERALGLGPVGKKPAGLPSHSLLDIEGPTGRRRRGSTNMGGGLTAKVNVIEWAA
jgi:hypothetical protein